MTHWESLWKADNEFVGATASDSAQSSSVKSGMLPLQPSSPGMTVPCGVWRVGSNSSLI